MATTGADKARDLFLVGLRNAHALETEAAQIIQRQLDRIVNYPEVADRLRLHLSETEHQKQRIEEILGNLGESHSSFKDMAAGFMGNMAAIAHAPAPDEILKNSFANLAFENYEIAAYTSLICLGETASQGAALSLLQQSLKEEESMATWVKDNLRPLTLKFAERSAQGLDADR